MEELIFLTSGSRRNFLKACLVLLASPALACDAYDAPWLARQKAEGRAALNDLILLLGDEGTAARLGQSYLREYPQERDLNMLGRETLGLTRAPSVRAFLERFIEARRRDYERQDVLVLQGWIVTRAEARLCAIVSLSQLPA